VAARRRERSAFVAMMANGTSGDINNINFRTPRPDKPPYEQMRYVAEDVAAKVNGALAKVSCNAAPALDARYRELDIAWRKIDDDLIQWAQTTEAKTPPVQDKVDLPLSYAGRVQRLAKASPATKLPAQLVRIGDVCIGTTPCETLRRWVWSSRIAARSRSHSSSNSRTATTATCHPAPFRTRRLRDVAGDEQPGAAGFREDHGRAFGDGGGGALRARNPVDPRCAGAVRCRTLTPILK